jgi:2-iminobutanoate/2-iminopropanoate deaminase
MQGEALQPEGLAVPSSPLSPVIVSGDLVFTAGQVGYGPDGRVVGDGLEEQARQTLENIRLCLEAAGCGLGDVLKVNAFLADLSESATFNAVYREFFHEPYPVRTTVQAGLAAGLRVEIEAVARRPS